MMNYTGGAEFYYNNRPDPTNSIDKIMNIFVKGVYFATINFFADYIGQSFGFSTFGANYPQFLGLPSVLFLMAMLQDIQLEQKLILKTFLEKMFYVD